jgi:hypothetical protein
VVREPLTLASAVRILDGEVIRHDWEGRPRYYRIRIYPAGRGEWGQRLVMVHVQLEADPSAFAIRHTDDDDACIHDTVDACIGQIAADMDSTWDREVVGELEDRYACESRYYYR